MVTTSTTARTSGPRPEKVAIVTEVREKLDAASGAILTEYRGLSVKDIATLRRTLREAGAEYKIYKNTLVRFAARDLGIDDLEPMLEGPTAVAFVEGDAAAVAKALRDFARTNPNLVVKGGLLGTKVLSAGDTAALADIPPREVLLARIAGGLAAPMQQFAGLLQALPRNLAYGLKALIEQGGAGDAPAAADAASGADAGDGTLGESPASDATATPPDSDAPASTDATPDLPESPASDATAEASPEAASGTAEASPEAASGTAEASPEAASGTAEAAPETTDTTEASPEAASDPAEPAADIPAEGAE